MIIFYEDKVFSFSLSPGKWYTTLSNRLRFNIMLAENIARHRCPFTVLSWTQRSPLRYHKWVEIEKRKKKTNNNNQTKQLTSFSEIISLRCNKLFNLAFSSLSFCFFFFVLCVRLFASVRQRVCGRHFTKLFHQKMHQDIAISTVNGIIIQIMICANMFPIHRMCPNLSSASSYQRLSTIPATPLA